MSLRLFFPCYYQKVLVITVEMIMLVLLIALPVHCSNYGANNYTLVPDNMTEVFILDYANT